MVSTAKWSDIEEYVEEFLELSNRVSWHDSALGACFQLGWMMRLSVRSPDVFFFFSLIELVNLILYLNGSDFEVEEIKDNFKSPHPAPSGTRRVSPAHPTPGTPTYLTNGSDHLRNPRYPRGRRRMPNPKASTPLKTGMISFAPEVSPVLSVFPVLSPKPAGRSAQISPVMALAPDQSQEKAPVPTFGPERAPVPTSGPRRASVPESSPEPLPTKKPEISPKLFFWGGLYGSGRRGQAKATEASPPWPPELLDLPWRLSLSSSSTNLQGARPPLPGGTVTARDAPSRRGE